MGAGTVLDPETARIAILAGAEFIVSPYLNKKVVALCNHYQIASMPGAMTIREVAEAMETGPLIKSQIPSIHSIQSILSPYPCFRLKIVFPAWWFNGHKDGIIRQLTALANLGLLGRFTGMITLPILELHIL